MFFKVIYYLIGMGIVFHKFYRLSNTDGIKDTWEVFRWVKDKKEKGEKLPTTIGGWTDNLGEDIIHSIIILLGVTCIEMIWMFVGLLSYNWLLFISYFVFFTIYNKITEKANMSSMSTFVTNTHFALYAGISVILFAIINSFHLHIDLVKLIFGA